MVDRGGGGIFFFNDTGTTEIYTLPLPDALPILIIWAKKTLLAHLIKLQREGRAVLHDDNWQIEKNA